MKPVEATGLGLLGVIMIVVSVAAGFYIYGQYKLLNSKKKTATDGVMSNDPNDIVLDDITNMPPGTYRDEEDGKTYQGEFEMTGTAWTNINGAWEHRHMKAGQVVVPASHRHRHIKDGLVVMDWHTHRSINDTTLPGWSFPVNTVYVPT